MLGHALLEACLVAALVLGFGPILRQPTVTVVVGGAGGLALLWFGQGMLRASRTAALSLTNAGNSATSRGNVLTGVLLSAANPYWSLWWATIGLSYLTLAIAAGPAGVASFYVGHILADLLWFSFVAMAVATGRSVMRDSVYRWLIGACGVFLLGLGAYFLFSTVKELF